MLLYLEVLLSVALAFIFGTAGFSKMRTTGTFRGQIVLMGYSAAVSRLASILIPILELVSAVLIIAPIDTIRAVGACMMIVLAFVFIGVTLRVILSGMEISCSCFGPHSDGKITSNTLIRNALLAAGTTVVLALNLMNHSPLLFEAFPAGSGPRWSMVAVLLTLLTLFVSIEGVLLWRLLNAYSSLVQMGTASPLFSKGHQTFATGALEGLSIAGGPEVGEMVDTAILVDTTTPKTTFGELFAEAHQDRAVFLFVGKHCPACDSLKPLVTELVSSGAIDSGQTMLQVLVVDQNESREASGVGPSWEDFILTAKRGGEFARQLPVRGTPAAILIGDTGEVLSPLTLGTSSVAEFLGTMFPTHSDPGRVPA